MKLDAETSGRKLSQEQARKRQSKAKEREIIRYLLRLAPYFPFVLCSIIFFFADSYSSVVIAPFL